MRISKYGQREASIQISKASGICEDVRAVERRGIGGHRSLPKDWSGFAADGGGRAEDEQANGQGLD